MKSSGQGLTLVLAALLGTSFPVACRNKEPPSGVLRTSSVVSTPTLKTTPVPQRPQGSPATAVLIFESPTPKPTETPTPHPTPILPVSLDEQTVDRVICDVASLLALAARPEAYEAFREATKADCGVFTGGEISEAPAVLPCYTCSLRLPSATATFYFYPDATGEVATLQQVHASSTWLAVPRSAESREGGAGSPAVSLRQGVDALIDAFVPRASAQAMGDIDGLGTVEDPSLCALRSELWRFRGAGAMHWLGVRRWESEDDFLVHYWEPYDVVNGPWRLGVLWRRAPLKHVETAWETDDPRYRRGPDLGPQDWRLGEQIYHRERFYPGLAAEACQEARLDRCDEGKLGIERLDRALLDPALSEAVGALSRKRDALDEPALVFWADQLAAAWGLSFKGRTITEEVDSLAAVGLKFDYTYCGEENELRRDLLKRLALERQATLWGHMAFRAMSWRGWAVRGDCQSGGEEWRWEGAAVIDRGEAFLAKHSGSPVATDVVFHVARAYEAWWAISHDTDYDHVDVDSLKPGADEARRKAIVYYRLYLDREKALPGLQRTWLRQKIFRLENSLNTWQWFYYCVCD